MTGPSDVGPDHRATGTTDAPADPAQAKPMVIVMTLVVAAFVMILNETILSVATGSPDASGLQLAFMAAGIIGLLAVGVSFLVRRKPGGGTDGSDAEGAGDGGHNGDAATSAPTRATPVAGH